MADLRIEHEQEVESGWHFGVQVGREPGAPPVKLTLTMSWADYDHWSSGTEPPSEIALQVLRFVLERRDIGELPPRFDAATVRRWIPEIDAALGRTR